MNDRPLVIGKGTKQRRDKYTWRYRHSLGKDPVTEQDVTVPIP